MFQGGLTTESKIQVLIHLIYTEVTDDLGKNTFSVVVKTDARIQCAQEQGGT